MSEELLNLPLREVLDIPETVTADDFVMQLDRGVEHSTATLQQYVVTDGIAAAMDDALGLVRKTVRERRSSGAFVHGSFGSGKSHFMAVLHLLLAGNAQAAAMPGLQSVVAKHSEVLANNYLLLDFHLLGKESMEQAIFGGYLDAVTERHPDQPPPVLHQSDALLTNATSMRAEIGDDAFFAALNRGAATSAPDLSGIGNLGTLTTGAGAAWTAERFERALAEGVAGVERTRLVQALTSTLFTGYVRTGAWLDMEAGLRAMTTHAQQLGYDGVVLFLDELVLWLAQHLSDASFIQLETSKVAKLVETGSGSLAVPLVSFVARQRDLKDFLGGASFGAEQAAIGESFRWWEDRFDRIELAAADLPKIVNQRLLQPRDERGRQALDAALARVKSNTQAYTTLLTDEANSSETDFRLVYPFSPALVDAMIALSSLMQRERTALKIMSELLSQGREHLRVRDVIGVGELFDAIVLSPAKPLTPEMRQRFAVAESFYTTRFRPYLLDKYGVSEPEATALERGHALRTEDLLMKTLLVAFIAPGTPALANLTAGKLAALNFGAVTAMIPGQEARQVTTWAREWSTSFGDVVVGEGTNPLINLQLSGVDYESVIGRVENEDTHGNRRKLIQDLLATELGLGESHGFEVERRLTYIWRGSRREVDVVFGNIREPSAVPTEVLRARNGRWRVVIDHPFDEPGHSPNDDLVRLANEREAGLETTTLCWVPNFLTANRLQDVGRLVLLEYLSVPARFDANANHLPVADREPARQALENQRRALRETVLGALRQAYGVAAPKDTDVDTARHEVFTALKPGLRVPNQVAATLREGLHKALDVALSDQYPDHPTFEPGDSEIKRSEVTKVLGVVRETVERGGRRDQLDASTSKLMARVTGPLGLGVARENVYALDAASFRWNAELARAEAVASRSGEVSVADLRAAIAPLGLVPDVQDLLILSWAALLDREIRHHGGPAGEVGIGNLKPDMTFRQPVLPDGDTWQTAQVRAEALFGIPREPHLSAAALGRAGSTLRERARNALSAVTELEAALHERRETLRLTPASPRMATATRARELIAALAEAKDDLAVVQLLAEADLPTEPQPLARSIATAQQVTAALRGGRWTMLEAVQNRPGGEVVLADLTDAAHAEELHSPLAAALQTAGGKAEQILIGDRPAPPPPPAPPAPAVDSIVLDFESSDGLAQVQTRLREFMDRNPGKRVVVSWRVAE